MKCEVFMHVFVCSYMCGYVCRLCVHVLEAPLLTLAVFVIPCLAELEACCIRLLVLASLLWVSQGKVAGRPPCPPALYVWLWRFEL